MLDKTNLEMLDQATRNRLAKLATVPVETHELERRLRAAVAQETDSPVQQSFRFNRAAWLRPVSALAAALLLAGLLGLLVMSLGQSPTIAAPADLAQLHKENTTGHAKVTPVTSIDQARAVLAGKWVDMPDIPMPNDMQLHACCVHDFLDSKVVCVFLMDGSTKLTLVVGHAKTFQPAPGTQITNNGRVFNLHQAGDLHMVMFEEQGRFVCLMGQTTGERLLTIAQNLTF